MLKLGTLVKAKRDIYNNPFTFDTNRKISVTKDTQGVIYAIDDDPHHPFDVAFANGTKLILQVVMPSEVEELFPVTN